MSADSGSSQPADPLGDHEQDHPHRQKVSRVFACVLCQRRKVKCDRNTPCYNCIKAKATCTPSTVAPPRKKRRPKSDLLDRVARCEALLRDYATSLEPNVDGVPAVSQSAATPTDPPPEDNLAKARTCGGLVVEDGSVRFMDKYLQRIIQENLQVMKEIIDANNVQEPSHASIDDATSDGNEDLLLNHLSAVEVEDTLPPAPQIFRLWQIFLERVNPLTKVIHVPTLQPFILEAATNHESIPDNYQALLYAIYLAAAVALKKEESQSMLDMDKNTALDKFTNGVKSALVRANFMRNYDLVTVQALILYITTLQGRCRRDEVWFLSGLVMRIARKLGLHRDGEAFQLGAFETEMRRRLWWQLVILDFKSAMTSGIRESLVPSDWDTKMPSNVNDADFSPQTPTIRPHDGPTEMVWCLILCTLGLFMHENRLLNLDEIMLAQSAEPGSREYYSYLASVDNYRRAVDALDARLLSAERRYCNPAAGPIHAYAASLRPHVVARLRIMLTPMRECPEWGTEVHNTRDNLFRISLFHHEQDLRLCKDFEWFCRSNFRIDSFLYTVVETYMRPQTGAFAERFWRLTEGVYQHQEDLWDLNCRQNAQLAEFVIQTWRVRQSTLLQMGVPHDVPTCVQRLLASLPQRGLDISSRDPRTEQQVNTSLPDLSGAEQLLGSTSGGLTDPILGNDASESINAFSIDKWENHTVGFPFDTLGNFGAPQDSGTGW